jgi:hypothetical protein
VTAACGWAQLGSTPLGVHEAGDRIPCRQSRLPVGNSHTEIADCSSARDKVRRLQGDLRHVPNGSITVQISVARGYILWHGTANLGLLSSDQITSTPTTESESEFASNNDKKIQLEPSHLSNSWISNNGNITLILS